MTQSNAVGTIITLGVIGAAAWALYEWLSTQCSTATSSLYGGSICGFIPGAASSSATPMSATLAVSGNTATVTIKGPPNSPVTIVGPGGTSSSDVGTTNSSGVVVTDPITLTGTPFQVTFSIANVGSVSVTFPAGPTGSSGSNSGSSTTPITPAVTQTTAVLSNATSPGAPFAAGDSFQLIVTGPPNSPVIGTASQNGAVSSSSPFGSTDANGQKIITGGWTAADIGNWQETWQVGSAAPAALNFSIAASGVSGLSSNRVPIDQIHRMRFLS
jgi:hypothetical protein